MPKKNWHSYDIDQIFKELKTDKDNGLSSKNIPTLIKKHGKNILPEEKKATVFSLIFAQFKSPLILILIVAGTITLSMGHFTDSIIIFSTVMLNTVIGFTQEKKASDVLSKLKSLARVKSYVIRDGLEKEVYQDDLAIGDIIILHAGNKVPADCRVVESHALKSNESALTGEWQPVPKTTETLPEKATIFEQKNMLFMGCGIDSGWGKAVVVEIAEQTEIGKIADLLKHTKKEKTIIQKKIDHLGRWISIGVVFIAVFVFFTGLLSNRSFLEMFLISVALAVAAIPEGLAVALTVILSLGMARILEQKGLVRNIISAETLGSTSVIATDKTGTLTEGNMQVSDIFAGKKSMLSDEKIVSKINKITKEDELKMLSLKTAVLCSEAFIENPEEALEKWVVRGDPMERSLIMSGINVGITEDKIKNSKKELERKPFDSASKYSAVLYDHDDQNYMLYVLGAPEILLDKSNKFDDKDIIDMDADLKSNISQKLEHIASKGQRIIATAYKKIPKTEGNNFNLPNSCDITKICNDLVFSGIISLSDPLRKDIKDVMASCKSAGINVIIVTGDHRLTAKAIAEEIGFKITSRNIVDGVELTQMTDQELKSRIKEIKVYARVEPSQKVRIVDAWKELGYQIAMTGDGINDAPALRRADIGIALESGTDIAKEAADLVLLSDDFSIVVKAIREGRKIVDNMKKTIVFMVCECFSEIVLILGSIVFGLPIFILPVQILWENLIEGSPQGIAIAFEPEEADIMKRKPESSKTPLFSPLMKDIIFKFGIITDIILFFIAWALYRNGMPIEEVRTFCFVGLAISSLFYGFSCKNFKKNLWQYNPFNNKWLNLSILFGWVMIILAVYNPVLQLLLKTVPLPVFDWILLMGLGIFQISIIEAVKWWHIKKST